MTLIQLKIELKNSKLLIKANIKIMFVVFLDYFRKIKFKNYMNF